MTLHYFKLLYNTNHYIMLQYITLHTFSLHYIILLLQCITIQYIHKITLNLITLDKITLRHVFQAWRMSGVG